MVLIDTAGGCRSRLMDELSKIVRVLKKIDPDAARDLAGARRHGGAQCAGPGERLREHRRCTGIVMTKLDGTARGGVLAPVAQASDSPIKLIGVGEGMRGFAGFRRGGLFAPAGRARSVEERHELGAYDRRLSGAGGVSGDLADYAKLPDRHLGAGRRLGRRAGGGLVHRRRLARYRCCPGCWRWFSAG